PFSDRIFNRCLCNFGLAVVWRCSQSDDRDLVAATFLFGTGDRVRPASRSRANRCCFAGYGLSELQQLKEDLAQLKQELQELKEIPAALASLRQSVDRLAGSQQQIVGTIAKLGTQKPASPPRPAPAPAPKPLTPPQSEVR